MISRIEDLTVGGGDDCPEYALSGIMAGNGFAYLYNICHGLINKIVKGTKHPHVVSYPRKAIRISLLCLDPLKQN